MKPFIDGISTRHQLSESSDAYACFCSAGPSIIRKGKRRRETFFSVPLLTRQHPSTPATIKQGIFCCPMPIVLCFLCFLLPYARSQDASFHLDLERRDLQSHVIEPLDMFGGFEIDVTPAPVSVPPVFPPTRRPTLKPTRRPSRIPTRRPTRTPTRQPNTNRPTMNPTATRSESPSAQPSTSPATRYPTLSPSEGPSFVPSLQPTLDPTAVQSMKPSAFPTYTPSRRTSAPSITFSMGPSIEPSYRPTVVAAEPPTERIFVNVTVPIGFVVDLMLRTTDTDTTSTLEAVEAIWEEAILSYFKGAFAGRPGIQPSKVDLTVSEQARRRLQDTSETVSVTAVGDADFSVDELSVEPDGFVQRATEEFPMVLSADMLQQAIDEAGASDDVTVASEISALPESTDRDTDDTTIDSSSSNKPTTAKIVLGFTLLIFTLASLLFWARVLHKKRKKHMRQRRLESLRKMHSVTYQASSLDQAATPKVSNTSEVMASREIPSESTSRIINSVPPTVPVLTKSETYEDTVGDEDATTDESDPFARELKYAASLDRVAWEELERSKKGKSGFSPGSVVGVAGANNVSMYDTVGNRSQDMGIEVEPLRVGSFPYGDENHNESRQPVHLNANNALKWTAAGISLMPFTSKRKERNQQNEAPGFSPYGDRAGRSLEESWDLDEFPVKDESGPSRFSFLYPLKRRDLNADVPDARRSPVSDSSVREDSVEVTSVGTPEFANVREIRDEDDGDDIESDNVSQSAITAAMLKELDDIANYVKEHEKMKRSRTSVVGRTDESQDVNDEIGAIQQKYPLSTGIGRSKYTMTGVLSPARSTDSSLGLSDEEDNDDAASQMSQRLGISRISVEKPSTAPLLTYKNSQDDPLQWDMETSSISPFPSNDFDSLRYSPSHSFDNKQMTINFAKESLLDGAMPIDQSCITEDSDDINSQIPGFANQDTAATASVPSKAAEMHQYLRRTVQTRQLPKEEEPEEMEPRVSPRVRSTDRKYNTIRSMFESKRTAPIVPPNESVSEH
jgi:hypothetical protein